MTLGSISPLTERPAWQALERHCRVVRDVHLRTLFADDPARGERLTAEAAGLYLDDSKNRITNDTLRLLLPLAEQSDLHTLIVGIFRGDRAASGQPGCERNSISNSFRKRTQRCRLA